MTDPRDVIDLDATTEAGVDLIAVRDLAYRITRTRIDARRQTALTTKGDSRD